MNGNIRKKILCVILAVAVLITTSCSTTGNLYAAELPQTQQEDQNLLETVQNTEDIADTENGAGTEDGLNTEDIADTEDTSNTGDTMDTESVADTEEDEEESEEEYAIESLLIEESDVIPSDHSLDVVYWNPNSQNSTSGTGQVLQYGGSDQNSGSTSKKPVLTLETALLRAAGNAVIYCMDYYGCSQNTAIDGNYYNVTIKRYTGYSGNILQITDGTLRLDNVTLDGSDSYADRVLTIGSNGKLEIGDSVGNVGNTFYFVESNANSVALVGTPESGTVYKVQFAAGYFNKAPVITEEGEEILLIDASASGLNPENYFNVLGLPDGWSVYLKDNT